VDAVRARGHGEVGPIVEDEQRPARLAALARALRGGEQVVVARGLVAQLHEVGATRQRAVERALEAADVGNEVQVRAGEARAALGRGDHG
jgi:hypothetical protein